MGTWNYRVMRKGEELAIYSVYYDENGRIDGYSTTPHSPFADDLDDLQNTLELMTKALSSPMLDYKD